MEPTRRYELLALHNQTMNSRLFELVGSLPVDVQTQDDGAFFGSIIGTLNHIIFGDLFIVTRAREALGRESVLDSLETQTEFEPNRTFGSSVAELGGLRGQIDRVVIDFTRALLPTDLERANAAGVPLWVILDQLFQHQTHHRGQATTLLSRQGLSYPSFADVVGIYRGDQSAV